MKDLKGLKPLAIIVVFLATADLLLNTFGGLYTMQGGLNLSLSGKIFPLIHLLAIFALMKGMKWGMWGVILMTVFYGGMLGLAIFSLNDGLGLSLMVTSVLYLLLFGSLSYLSYQKKGRFK